MQGVDLLYKHIKIEDINPIKHLSLNYLNKFDKDVKIAEISDNPINGFKGTKQLHSVLIPLDEVDIVLNNKGGIDWRVNSMGPKPYVDYGEVFDSSFWVYGIDKNTKYEPLIHTWLNHNKTVFLPSNGLLMCYGLVPRIKKNEIICWDDPTKPLYDVVVVNPLSEYESCFNTSAGITIRKDYLEDFCSLKACAAVSIFYEERFSKDDESIIKILNGSSYKSVTLNGMQIDIQKLEHETRNSNQLVKVWGCKLILEPKERPISGIEKKSFIWPDYENYISAKEAKSFSNPLKYIYVQDEALIKFQDNDNYLIYPESGDISYGAWWSTDRSYRVGRNYISMELRKLYEGVPSDIIEHLNKFAVSKEIVSKDKNNKNIAIRAKSLINSFLKLGEELEYLCDNLMLSIKSKDLISFDYEEIDYEGWYTITYFRQLSNVSLENMSKNEFLERCVILFKLIEYIKMKNLRLILIKLGFDKKKISSLGNLKLLGTLIQLFVIAENEGLSLVEDKKIIIEKWNEKDIIEELNPIFAVNGLRNIHSHVNDNSSWDIDSKLKVFDFESYDMVHGWGKGLDIVYDRLIESFTYIATIICKNK